MRAASSALFTACFDEMPGCVTDKSFLRDLINCASRHSNKFHTLLRRFVIRNHALPEALKQNRTVPR
jgi:hypothetical protein